MAKKIKTIKNQGFIVLGIGAFLFGCIGEDPNSKKTDTPAAAPATTTTPVPATPAKSTTATTTADGKPIEFTYISNSFPSTLYSHYAGFAKNNTSLDKRIQVSSEGNFTSIFKLIDLWSNKNFWNHDDGRKLNDILPDGSIATIKNTNGPSVVQVDTAYTLEKLTVDSSCGVYVPKDGALLTQTLNFQNSSFAIVSEGRIGSQTLTMLPDSFLDLIGGNGCVVNAELKDLKVEDSTPKGVLTLGENGSVSLDRSYISANKIEQQGDIKVSQAVFNLQPMVSGTMTNIEYLHQKGKIQPLPGKPEFFFRVNGLYKLKSDAEVEMFVYADSPYAASIQLIHKPDLPVTSAPTEDDKPSIEGKILLAPYGSLTNTTGILLIDSDVEFSATTINNVSRLLHEASKKIGNHAFALKMSENKKQILLDITPSTLPLKANHPIQSAARSFRLAAFKSDLLDSTSAHITRFNIGNVELFASQNILSTQNTSIYSSIFGLKHEITTEHGCFDICQTWGQTRVSDYIYRFTPEAIHPFWILQHSINYNIPFKIGNLRLTPSAGLSQLLIPETRFQGGVQTVIPCFSLTGGFNYTVDSSTLSMNAVVSTEYQHGIIHLSDQPWGINTGINMKLHIPSIELSTILLNPFQPSAEFYMNISVSF